MAKYFIVNKTYITALVYTDIQKPKVCTDYIPTAAFMENVKP